MHDALDSTAFQVRKTLNQSQQDGINEALSTRPNSVYAHSVHGNSRPTSPVHSPAHSDDELSAPSSPAGEHVSLPQVYGVVRHPSDEAQLASGQSTPGLTSMLHKAGVSHDNSAHSDHHVHLLAHDRARKRDRKLHFPMLRSRSSHHSATSHHHLHHKTHSSHTSLLEKLRRVQEPVGLFESQRYECLMRTVLITYKTVKS